MDVLWKPWKLVIPVGVAVIAPLACLAGLFIVLAYFTILQLPWGQDEAMAWFLGGEAPTGVVVAEGYSAHADGPLPASAYALDTGQLTDWFGGHVTSGFHDPDRPSHSGVDVSLVSGTPIPSTLGGEVVYAGWSDAGYGNLVIVQNGDWQTYYGHLSVIGVQPGDQVGRGDTVGLSGNTGRSTGPHLHYEVRLDGTPIAPSTTPGDAGEGDAGGDDRGD